MYQTEDSVVYLGYGEHVGDGGEEPEDDAEEHDGAENVEYCFVHGYLAVVGFYHVL